MARVNEINDERMALSIARCNDRLAFVGRCMVHYYYCVKILFFFKLLNNKQVACSSRGGKVFDCFVALLCNGGEHDKQKQWPLLSTKVRALLTGE